jgi:hypothetical protein
VFGDLQEHERRPLPQLGSSTWCESPQHHPRIRSVCSVFRSACSVISESADVERDCRADRLGRASRYDFFCFFSSATFFFIFF